MFGSSSLSAHISLLQTARLKRHGAITQVTLGPLHAGGSICAGKIKQRHDPQALSMALQSLSTLHARLAAAGMLGVLGSDPLGSGALGADASSSEGACMPEDPERIGRVPTRVISAESAGLLGSDAAVGFDCGSLGTDAAVVSCSGALES